LASPPNLDASNKLELANLHPRALLRPAAIAARVAQACTFHRIANIGTRAPHAARVSARRSNRAPRPFSAATSATASLPIICWPLLARQGCSTPQTSDTAHCHGTPARVCACAYARARASTRRTTKHLPSATCHQYRGANSLHGRCLKPHSLLALRRWRTSCPDW
jgi:hypothetical protein